jgi:hypothetical protein
MRKLDEILSQVNESNSNNMMGLVSSLRKLDFVEDLIDIHYLSDGIVAYVKTKDGKYYQYTIKPAEYAKHFENDRA